MRLEPVTHAHVLWTVPVLSPRAQDLLKLAAMISMVTDHVGALLAPDVIVLRIIGRFAINGDIFVAFVQQLLVPTLRPGHVVIMDRLSAHKRAEVRELIEAAGCELCLLPAYSPDLNPAAQAR
jgi:DDE superfamily endonuclease/TraX protein